MEQDKVLDYLKREPRFRERSNKDRGIVNLLTDKYPLLKNIPKEMLINFIQDANSYDRYWRLMLDDFHYPELRGSDYETKKKVVQRKQKILGYESGFFQLSNLSKTLNG